MVGRESGSSSSSSGREFARVLVAQHSCDKDDDVGGSGTSSSSTSSSNSSSSSSGISGGGSGDGGSGGGGGGSGGDGGEGAASSMVVVLPVVEEAWVGSSVRAAAPCRTRTIHPDADGVATLSEPAAKNVLAEATGTLVSSIADDRAFHVACTSTRVRFSHPRDTVLSVGFIPLGFPTG
ncbi:hypothetical protein K0M31_012181 [Melipona bicolor]|uniref:Uncharacterized protein n=1 Tax=Melipona bicolor TaxID=60889 RepID=A0AA40FKL0_9HYME|nr:hypothetical protein K0M31_012181 [Melipona bicolor]